MIVTFLGTGSGAPSTKRNVSGIALRFIQPGKWWLFDCGEGTQHQVLRAPLKLSQLERIFITHLHGDHLYGLVGLLASRSLRGGAPGKVTLYGPSGIDAYWNGIMAVSPVFLQYALDIQVITEGTIYEDDELIVRAAPVQHRVPTYAYSIEEKTRPGAFRADLAERTGIPVGPLYGALKRGETIQLPDGRMIYGSDFVGPEQTGRKVVISGDTQPCRTLVQLARDADLLIHEATYVSSHKELAIRSGHSTSKDAAITAREADVKELILTHVSPRYEHEEGTGMAELLEEAQQVYSQTLLAEDFFSYMLKRRREIV